MPAMPPLEGEKPIAPSRALARSQTNVLATQAVEPVAVHNIAETLDSAGTPNVISASPVPIRDPELPDSIGRFQVRCRLGEGAFGTVHHAHDPHLDREVALKVAKPGTINTPQRVERFLREARSAAQLRHPNIVPLFEAGQDSGHYYIASAYIRGESLEATLERGPLSYRESVAIVQKLAEALAYAHEQGIVHRDVKPANTMLDEKGQPLLMDFGLAVRHHESERLTQDGAILGTPLYMPPEMAAGQRGEALPASDQYSLGVVLYEMLCGRAPFDGKPEVVLYHHLQTEPVSPRRHRPDIPRDLETICLKTLAKRPQDRFFSCQELAADLRRFLDGEPIKARRHSLAERLVRWCRREPKLAAASGVAVLALAAVAGLMTVSARTQAELTREAREEKDKALAAHHLAETALTEARGNLYHHLIVQAARAWTDNRCGWAAELLAQCPPDLRQWEHSYIMHGLFADRVALLPHTTELACLTFSPDGKRLATAGRDRTVSVWDTSDGQKIQTLTDQPALITCLALSPDGQSLAVGGATVSLWDVSTARPMRTFVTRATHLAFSPDGRQLAIATPLATIQIWEASTGRRLSTLDGHDAAITCLAFSPERGSTRLASAGQDHIVKVWDVTTGKAVHVFAEHREPVLAVAFSPSGHMLTAGDRHGIVRTWAMRQISRARSPHPGREEGNPHAEREDYPPPATQPESITYRPGELMGCYSVAATDCCALAIDPEGTVQLVVALPDHTAQLTFTQALEPDRPIATLDLRGHAERLTHLVFGPSGHLVATASENGVVRLWESRRGSRSQIIATVKGLDPELAANSRKTNTHVTFSPDNRLLSMATQEGVQVKDLRTLQVVLRCDDIVEPQVTAFSPDGKQLAVAGTQVRLFDLVTGRKTAQLGGKQASPTTELAFSPDGQRLAAASERGAITVWDLHGRRPLLRWQAHDGMALGVAFCLDGKRLATAGEDSTVKLWDPATARLLATLADHESVVWDIAVSPNGRSLATVSEDETCRLWDAQRGELVRTMRVRGAIATCVVFGASGQRLFTGHRDGSIKLWVPETGEEVGGLRGHEKRIESLSASTDGLMLASASRDQTIRIWNATKPSSQLVAARRQLTAQAALNMDRRWSALDKVEHPSIATFSLSRLIEASPGDAALYLRRGRTRATLRQWDRAVVDFTRTLELGATGWQPWAERGRARARQGHWQEAEADYRRAAAAGADQSWVWNDLALVCLALGNERGYKQAYKELRQRFDLTDEPRTELDLDQLLAAQPNDWRLHLRRHDYQRALELAPGEWRVYAARAEHRKGPKWTRDQAVADFAWAVDLGGTDWRVWMARAHFWEKLGEKEKAMGDLHQAVRLGDAAWQVWLTRARFRSRNSVAGEGETPQTLGDYRTAVERGAPGWQVWFEMAELEMHSGAWELAAADLTRAIERSPDQPHLWHGRGLVWMQLGDYGQAAADQREAIRRGATDWHVAVDLARALARQGHWNEAALACSQAIHPEIVGQPERGAPEGDSASDRAPAWQILALALHADGDLGGYEKVRRYMKSQNISSVGSDLDVRSLVPVLRLLPGSAFAPRRSAL
jgi:WD40 repeat protein/Flp pilus assembly protein TadD